VAGYKLRPDEFFVLKHDNVRHGDGFWANYTDELILTSRNLVLIKKGAFGKNKSILVFPLNEIKIYQGHAQAVLGKLKNGSCSLDVYFLYGVEQFGFVNKKDANFWSQKINEVVTGAPAKMVSPDSSTADKATQALKDTVAAFKGAFGKAEVPVATVPVTRQCVSCAATVAGLRGQAVTCSYCGTANQL